MAIIIIGHRSPFFAGVDMGAGWGAIVQLAGGEMDPHLASMKGEYWNVHSMLTSGMDPNERSEEDGGALSAIIRFFRQNNVDY